MGQDKIYGWSAQGLVNIFHEILNANQRVTPKQKDIRNDENPIDSSNFWPYQKLDLMKLNKSPLKIVKIIISTFKCRSILR